MAKLKTLDKVTAAIRQMVQDAPPQKAGTARGLGSPKQIHQGMLNLYNKNPILADSTEPLGRAMQEWLQRNPFPATGGDDAIRTWQNAHNSFLGTTSKDLGVPIEGFDLSGFKTTELATRGERDYTLPDDEASKMKGERYPTSREPRPSKRDIEEWNKFLNSKKKDLVKRDFSADALTAAGGVLALQEALKNMELSDPEASAIDGPSGVEELVEETRPVPEVASIEETTMVTPEEEVTTTTSRRQRNPKGRRNRKQLAPVKSVDQEFFDDLFDESRPHRPGDSSKRSTAEALAAGGITSKRAYEILHDGASLNQTEAKIIGQGGRMRKEHQEEALRQRQQQYFDNKKF